MRALILKDFYSWKKNFLMYIGLSLLFAGWSVSAGDDFPAGFIVTFAPLQCLTITGLDISKQGSLTYLLTTPVSRKKYVLSRYLLALIMTSIPIILLGIAQIITILRGGSSAFFLGSLGLNLFLGIFCFAAALPAVLKFGQERSSLILIIIFAPLLAGTTFFTGYLHANSSFVASIYNFAEQLKLVPIAFWIALILLIISALITLSIHCATKIMQKKEF